MVAAPSGFTVPLSVAAVEVTPDAALVVTAGAEVPLQVTVSIGVAALQPSMQHSDLYRVADEMLYRAKRLGRNQVCH